MTDIREELNSASLEYVEELYLRYLRAPEEVPERWREAFRDMPGNGLAARSALGPAFRPRSLFNPPSGASPQQLDRAGSDAAGLQQRLDRLVRNYRVRGHRLADLSPLGREPFEAPEVDPNFYGFTASDLGRQVLDTTFPNARTLREIIEALKETYTRSIGVQFMHIDDSTCAAGCSAAWRPRGTGCSSAAHGSCASSPPDRRRDLRGVHPEEVHRRQELLPRGRRDA